MSTKFFQGDQFVGYNVDPTTGDLVLRYVMVIANKPDANGRGVTNKVLEQNRSIAKGRPLIFAPQETQGGTRGHTDFRTTDPYKYEIGRIVNIEPASTNLMNRIRNNLMVQTNSSYVNLLQSEKDLWVADVIITNPEAKKILLNPATSHLIPRYVSPSFIHRRNPNGDYSRVDDAILDHIAIVNKPIFSNDGKQIDGAAYGEVTKLRGSCFGDKIACLNLLQTSSNKVVELEKCVSCPVQLLDRLTELYKNLDIIIQIEQSSSQIMSSENSSNTQTPANNQVVTTTTSPTNNNNQQTTTETTPISTGQTTVSTNPLSNLFKNDEQLQTNYNNLKNLVTQMVKEDPTTFRNAILVDANETNNNTTNNNPPSQTTPNQDNSQTGNTDNLQSGEIPQKLTNEQVTETLQKLKITEDELKNMKVEDIKKKFGDIENVVKTVLEEQIKTSKTLQQIREREEKIKIANILPREAFSDERGFKQKEFDDMVNYLHKIKLDQQYIAILGVGLATMKNEQLKIKEQQLNLKKGNLPQGFGESIKQKILAEQNNNNNPPSLVIPPPSSPSSSTSSQNQQQQTS